MSDYYLGEIRLFAGNYAPDDWALCDGSVLPITGNEALYSLIGNVWGGSAPTSFGLPDLRGRILVGQGSGAGLTPRVLAQTGGSQTVTLSAAQLPEHTHALNALSAPVATTGTPSPSVLPAALPSQTVGYISPPNQTTTFPFGGTMISDEGGSQSHANEMPSLGLTYMICTAGLYPQRP